VPSGPRWIGRWAPRCRACRRTRPATQYAAGLWRRGRQGPAEELNNELAWYADLLGQARNREVLSTRLIERIAELPSELVRGRAEAQITKTLATEQDNATERLNKATRTPRTQHLVRLLRGWKIAPPLSDAANGKDKTAARYVRKANRKADRRPRNANATWSSYIGRERR
jgi:CHAD domain